MINVVAFFQLYRNAAYFFIFLLPILKKLEKHQNEKNSSNYCPCNYNCFLQ